MAQMTAKRFAKARRRLFMSPEAMAARFGVTAQTIKRWEAGQHPVPQTVAELVERLLSERVRRREEEPQPAA